MFSVNDKISVRQLQALMMLEIFGTGVIILPRVAAGFANQDGWLVIIVSTVVAMAAGFIYASLGRLFPRESFVDYTGRLLSRPVAVIIALGFVFKIIVTTAMELRAFGEIIKLTMLNDTPFGVICASMLLVSAAAAAKGCEARGRIAQILVVLAFVPLGVAFVIGVADVDFSNLKPVMVTPPTDIIHGGLFSFRAFTGIEFILLIYPFVNNNREVRRKAVGTIFVIGVLMLLITLVTLAKFGPFDIAPQMWPTLEMMDAIDLPGSFVERLDALIMSFWVISVFAITNAGLFFAALLLKNMLKPIPYSGYIALCVVLMFIISFVPASISEVYVIMEKMFLTFGVVYMLVVPVVLLVVAKVGGKA